VSVMAGSVELDVLLPRLRQKRPVFHSEADFQHALAWEAHQMDPELQIRLETHPEPNVRLDLLLTRPDLHAYTVVELKYLTALWSGVVNGEQFALKNQGAQDVRAYDIEGYSRRLIRLAATACLHEKRSASRKNWVTTLNSKETDRRACAIPPGSPRMRSSTCA
jgi:ribosomal protein L33